MRNAGWILTAALMCGCATNTSLRDRQDLQAGYQALERRDYEAAMNAADRFLRDHPQGGPGTAEALYLQGRVYEQRAMQDDAGGRESAAKSNLEYARQTYIRALHLPGTALALTSLIHAGVANVAYFQEDYSTAMDEWAIAYPGVPDAEARAWILYRIGVCQQRLGRFDQADRNFATVRRDYPGSVPAARAATHEGVRGFYVQIGAYSDSANAARIAAALSAEGYPAVRGAGPAGRGEVRVGPVGSYVDAQALQRRLQVRYPGAIIEP